MDGDEEVITTLINDGVDMDAVIYQVCQWSILARILSATLFTGMW